MRGREEGRDKREGSKERERYAGSKVKEGEGEGGSLPVVTQKVGPCAVFWMLS